MDKLRLIYVPREDATPEGEHSALAAVYRFILERHECSKDARSESGEESARSSSSQEYELGKSEEGCDE
jgi:hypothetical protein